MAQQGDCPCCVLACGFNGLGLVHPKSGIATSLIKLRVVSIKSLLQVENYEDWSLKQGYTISKLKYKLK
jgi:hypothetical protein